jgi:hypothetical protein
MHTCSRPCNNDIDRRHYLADVDDAIAFIQGQEDRTEQDLLKRIGELANEEKFEEAESARRHLEKIQRARKDVKDKFPSVWSFDYLVLLPTATTARTRVAFVRGGRIVGFDEYDTATLCDSLPPELSRRFAVEPPAASLDWQYDEFCLVANYLVHPLKSVELIRVDDELDLPGYLKKYSPPQLRRGGCAK